MQKKTIATGKMLIMDVLRGVVSNIPMERRLSILMDVINEGRESPYTGVQHPDGTIYGDAGNVIQWGEFVMSEVTVGNISI